MSESKDTRLALQVLNSAKAARGRVDGLLHHSDRGSPFGSALYTERLCALLVQPSKSESVDCPDNAVIESFFSTLKWELLRKRSFATHIQARRAVNAYIDQFFNPIKEAFNQRIFQPDRVRSSLAIMSVHGIVILCGHKTQGNSSLPQSTSSSLCPSSSRRGQR